MYNMIVYAARYQDSAEVELIPEREDTQPDSPLEDTVSATLKRENSIRRSQRGRLDACEVVEWNAMCKVQRVQMWLKCLIECLICPYCYSVRLRKNSSVRLPKDVDDSKKGQKLIEKETMETGQVMSALHLLK